MIYKLINIEQRYRALKKHSLLSQINANACVSNLKQKYVKYLKDTDIAEIRKKIHLELLDEIDYLYYNFMYPKLTTWEVLQDRILRHGKELASYADYLHVEYLTLKNFFGYRNIEYYGLEIQAYLNARIKLNRDSWKKI